MGVKDASKSKATEEANSRVVQMMYSTDAFQKMDSATQNYAQLYNQAKLTKSSTNSTADEILSRDRVPTRNRKSRKRVKRMVFKEGKQLCISKLG